MARLLLGVTGGIAAYKAAETARLAVRAGHAVRVIQTPTSERFIGRATFEGITGAPVLVSEFDHDPSRGAFPGEPRPERAPISHLALVENADVYLIAPASANTIAKLAHGLADNLVTTAALAAPCPVAVAPAMNARMFEHPATVANLELVADARGHRDRTGNRRARLARGVRDRAPGGTVGAGRDLRAAAGAADMERSARARDRRRNAGADRQRALHRQSLIGPDGDGARRRGGAPGSGGDRDRRQRHIAGSRPA